LIGKGDKERLVPLPEAFGAVFGFWLKDRARGEFVFARAAGQKPVSAQAARAYLRGMLQKAGIDQHNRLLNLAVLAKAAGMPVSTLYSRLKQHGDLARALRQPRYSTQRSGRLAILPLWWLFPPLRGAGLLRRQP
jgi:hypothetical protein